MVVEEDTIEVEVATTMVKTMAVAKEAKETTMILKAEGASQVLCSMHRSTQDRQKIHRFSAALSHIFPTTTQRYRRILTWTSQNLSTPTRPFMVVGVMDNSSSSSSIAQKRLVLEQQWKP